MASSRLAGVAVAVVLALCGSGAAAVDDTTTTTVATTTKASAFPDVGETCTLKYNCTGNGAIPLERGVCVQGSANGGTTCRDVCNGKYAPQQYLVGTNAQENSAFAGIVEEVRCGRNLFVQCPADLADCPDICPLGTECPRHMLKKFKIPEGRGICVIQPGQDRSRACWDMCDASKLSSKYTEGTSADVQTKVEQTRSSTTCPAGRWWPIVIGTLVALLVCSCCAAALVAQRNRKNKQRAGRSEGAAAPPLNRYDNDPELDGYGEQEGYASMGEPTQRDMPSPHEDQLQMEDMRAQREYQMQQQQFQALPPEPPREEPSARQSQRPGSQRDDMQRNLIDVGSYRSGGSPPSPQQAHYGMPPASSSMAIPGLSEPNLFANIQPLQMPGQQGSSLMPSMSQPPAMTQYRTQSMGAQSYSTQVPPAYMTSQMASPPTSVQVGPGVLGMTQSAPQQTFFTQIARR